MDKEFFMQEVERRLKSIFNATKLGYKIPSTERHRCEGFMQAGIFLKISSRSELQELMDNVHFSVFSQTIEQRRKKSGHVWQEEVIDYSQYDLPPDQR